MSRVKAKMHQIRFLSVCVSDGVWHIRRCGALNSQQRLPRSKPDINGPSLLSTAIAGRTAAAIAQTTKLADLFKTHRAYTHTPYIHWMLRMCVTFSFCCRKMTSSHESRTQQKTHYGDHACRSRQSRPLIHRLLVLWKPVTYIAKHGFGPWQGKGLKTLQPLQTKLHEPRLLRMKLFSDDFDLYSCIGWKLRSGFHRRTRDFTWLGAGPGALGDGSLPVEPR